MSDRLPGSSWDNPIWYRDYRIHIGDTCFANYVFAHDDYDGADDAADSRCGYAQSVDECKRLIDAKIED